MADIPPNLIITEQFKSIDFDFGRNKEVDVENLDPSKENSPKVTKIHNYNKSTNPTNSL